MSFEIDSQSLVRQFKGGAGAVTVFEEQGETRVAFLLEAEALPPPPAPDMTGWNEGQKEAYAQEQNERPIEYRDRVYVRIRQSSSKDFVSMPATLEHRREYPQAWADFDAWQQKRQTSTPMIAAPWATPAVLRTLGERGLIWLEDLAAHEGDLPPGYDAHRAWAQRFVRFKNGEKPRVRSLGNGEFQEVAA